MDRLGEVQLREIETRLSRRMVTEFGLDLTGLTLDMTNFACSGRIYDPRMNRRLAVVVDAVVLGAAALPFVRAVAYLGALAG